MICHGHWWSVFLLDPTLGFSGSTDPLSESPGSSGAVGNGCFPCTLHVALGDPFSACTFLLLLCYSYPVVVGSTLKYCILLGFQVEAGKMSLPLLGPQSTGEGKRHF